MPDRIGIIADVHGNALALAEVLRDAEEQGVDRFVDLGDTLYGPLQPAEAYRLFREAPIVAGVRGNQDRKIYEESPPFTAALDGAAIDWLRALRPAVIYGDFFLCHGTPSSDTTYLLEDVRSGGPAVRTDSEILRLLGGVTQPVVLCGHSHISRVVRTSNGQLVVNPGSVGLPAYDDDSPVEHCMENYSPHASYAVMEKIAGAWTVALRRVAYDWDAAAGQAYASGAEDWARGLATGRMR
jgi:putative phosphoesterase